MSKNFVDNANATALMEAVEESIANTRIFRGTLDEWDALTPEEQAKYAVIATPGEEVIMIKETEAEISDIVNVYGAKNLLRYPYIQTTKTYQGITFTDNGDGTITVDGTKNGSTQDDFRLCYLSDLPDNINSVIVSSGVELPSDSNFYMAIIYKDNGNGIASIRQTPYTLNITSEMRTRDVIFIIRVRNQGTDIDNVTFSPMIRLASIQDDTYVPYAKTNKELTDNLKVKTIEFTSQASTNDGKLILTGMGHKMAIVSSRLLDDSNNHLIVPFGFCYSTNGDALFMLADNSDNTIISSAITISGTIAYLDLS